MVPMPAEGEADTSLSTKVAANVEIGIQAFADRDVAKLETCLMEIVQATRELLDKQPYENEDVLEAMMKEMGGDDEGQEKEMDGDDEDQEEENEQNEKQAEEVYQEYERMTQLPGTRLPELIRLCIDQEDCPQIVLLTAEINLKLDRWRSTDDDELSLHLIPDKLFRIMTSSQDLAVLKRAFVLSKDFVFHATCREGFDPISNPLLEPGFVDILLRLGMQYPEHTEFNSRTDGIPCFLEDNLCTTKYLGSARATAVIRKVLNVVADIIANDASSPALMAFALRCFSSVSLLRKRGELRIMIDAWIQEGLARLIELLHRPDHGVQIAAMGVFQDVIRSNPETAKQVVDGGIFVRVAAALNRQEFDDLGDIALRLLCKCIKQKPENSIIEGIVQAQIPVILSQRLLLRNNDADINIEVMVMRDTTEGLAVQCLRKLCEFIPLTLAKNLLESGSVLEWLNYIKEDHNKFLRVILLKAILKHLSPTLKNGHLPSFEALTHMISETVGLDFAQRIEAVETPEDLGIFPDPEYVDEFAISTFFNCEAEKCYDSEGTEEGSGSEGTDEGSDSEGTDEGSGSEGTDEGMDYDD